MRFSEAHTSLDPNWDKDIPLEALIYERPLTPVTVMPALVFAPSLGCWVRPQPSEFLRLSSSAPFHRTIRNAIPLLQRHERSAA